MTISDRISHEEMEKLRSELIEDEGFRTDAYKDPLGFWTIGIGHFLGDHSVPDITREQVFRIFNSDLETVIHELDLHISWWDKRLDVVRKRALINLCFNMGITTLLTFKNMLRYLSEAQYEDAAEHLKISAWYHQVQKSRSDRIVNQIRTGS